MPPRKRSTPQNRAPKQSLPKTRDPASGNHILNASPASEISPTKWNDTNLQFRIRRFETRRQSFYVQKNLAFQRGKCNYYEIIEQFKAGGGDDDGTGFASLSGSLEPPIDQPIPQTWHELEAMEKELDRREEFLRNWKRVGILIEKHVLISEATAEEEIEKRCWEAYEYAKREGYYVGKEASTITEVMDVLRVVYTPIFGPGIYDEVLSK
ncbi:hypothetical protein BJ508DRAFT_336496 [Ascobolus immersus RN42]|uniref:Uncharacterized protein n=1 Tax=Ascobolus immersus RN42 TaxID=1160509 RepID=A0A3N4HD82_ASCIM|nr:hypothetical protein BJ508DRAFT_336496 [Ascobolus immersus RN42]